MTSVFTANQVSQSFKQSQSDEPRAASRPITFSRTRLFGQVGSLMTRHTTEGDDHFVLLALADGSLFRGKWRSIPCEPLPRLGNVMRIEIEQKNSEAPVNSPQPAKTAHQPAGKVCCQITNWQVIHALYSLDTLDRLYKNTEEPEALDRLWGILHHIPVPCLQEWLSDLFAQPRLLLPFVQVPASHNHHHSHAGGLLLHSVESAEWVEQMATGTLNSKEAALSIVAALLHNLGTIETMNLKTAVGTYEKPFVLMYRSMNGFSYVHPWFCPKARSPFYTSGRTGFGATQLRFLG